MKPDELKLFLALADEHGGPYNPSQGKFARDIGKEMGMHPKRINYLCEKWTQKGRYEYGTCVDLGWLTPQGFIMVKAEEWLPGNSGRFVGDEPSKSPEPTVVRGPGTLSGG